MRVLEREENKFKPFGEIINSYSMNDQTFEIRKVSYLAHVDLCYIIYSSTIIFRIKLKIARAELVVLLIMFITNRC